MARIINGVFKRFHLFLLFVLIISVIGFLLVAIYPINDNRGINHSQNEDEQINDLEEFHVNGDPIPQSDGHKLAVIIPFRDRFEELMVFVPHMSTFLRNQNVPHRIFVINQIDTYRFNRASLINIGFLESKQECDYIAMHDVDLLPLNPALNYKYPQNGVFHIAAPNLHPLYHYEKFVGGILLITGENFEKLNGLSNKYWGWGLEDDEFYVRMKKQGIKIYRPEGITTGNKTFQHIHDKRRRTRDKDKFFDQREKTRRLDKVTGVNTVQYTIDSQHDMVIDGGKVTIINVRLKCDIQSTPWCLMKEDHVLYEQLKDKQKRVK
ncbi:hypothetical protein LOTGIDRAFT_211278 [Lottia gigantea]|uniref:Beta-1,4-galactosyltransferase n=1 Tax=Lottia gigantea TaxID=225164 RepID=V3ZP35_LOTGI|nr:hypothetical protein LOTGIDRAFT_211278 [Lottia gigantea]ESO82616.1 hypothetical protein LOTGIDRAFT_211278 [Lottia gigantea]